MAVVRMRSFINIALISLLALPFAAAMAAPMGYSVNSDEPLGDTLHRIDLADGSATPIGISVSSLGVTRKDIEGLAIAPDLSLWGVDEDKLKLFRIDTTSGTVMPETEVKISGLDSAKQNDFGLTFSCNGTLYATSVFSQSLYVIDLAGNASRVGAKGSLGVNISAIASSGSSPIRLYGLGNGLLGDEGPLDNRSLYRIDVDTGVATAIGEIGPTIANYSQAGLAFDAAGDLWAITDRSQSGLDSEILRIDLNTGVGTLQSATTIIGFESLAIAPPVNCNNSPDDRFADAQRIPVLDSLGRLLVILALLFTGLVSLRQRFS